MYIGLSKKFADEHLADLLLETGDEYLEEGTTWHDNEWGNCSCPKCKNIEGKNILGQLLMKVRDDVKNRRGL